ncbi:hypothetical protein LUZ63_015521 [Rhynchospora breviuscula]|uniref:DUF4378 domain-containing protein n=1 Tax=Rhynchospora breviuscula TaxID=2022672 RepID=A0A9Q0CCH1_9POAL|nr:hypothetical protein LUZ63_015521 [Rhynchospora breviuscula]
MVGPSLQHQESHVYMRDFRGCRWALIQWFDFQRRLKFLPGSKFKSADFPFSNQDGDSTDMDSDLSITSKHSTGKKPSRKPKSILKSFIPKKFYRKQDQKQKILPLSPQLLRTISIHHLEPKKSNSSSASTSSSTSSSTSGSSHGNADIMKSDSSSRNENDSILPRHLNVIQEKNISKSSSLPSRRHPDLSDLDTFQNFESNQNRPQVNKSFKRMITMDSMLHKVPYGQKLPEYSKFSTNLNLFRSVSVTYDRGGSHQVMKRSRSLSDSVGRYSQIMESLSRESSRKTTQTGARPMADDSLKEVNTIATDKSQGKDSNLTASESLPIGTELTKDGLFEAQNITEISLQPTDTISSVSETVVDEAFSTLPDGAESVPGVFMQDIAKDVGSGSETLESCKDLNFLKEREKFVGVQDEAGLHISDYEIFQESSVSVLDSEFLDHPIPAEIQNLEDGISGANYTSDPNLKNISDGSKTFGENTDPFLADSDILPLQLVQGNEADLDNLKDQFENFGFGDGDFLEVINFLLQEVHQENEKIPFGYDLTKFDYDFRGFDYDENMSLDQNILYALTHEVLRENLKKHLRNGTLVSSYTMVPRSNSLQNGLIKDLWKNLNSYLNSEIYVSGRNFIEGIMTNNSLQNDGWLNYSIEKEHLVVELGDEIFDSIIGELICEAC